LLIRVKRVITSHLDFVVETVFLLHL
jgi:hypothetical protein